MKMNRHDKIEEFLDYGGNQLFSTLMGSDMQRSVGTDRLIELLQAYSDSCRRIKGRSAAYRFMLKKAAKLGWLGKGSGDLKSHRLTQADRAYIMKKLDDFLANNRRLIDTEIAENSLSIAFDNPMILDWMIIYMIFLIF